MNRDQNTAELSIHEALIHELETQPLPLPDFTQAEDLREAGVCREHQSALASLMEVFQGGVHADRDELMRACAKLERALLSTWEG
jgi:hypothetical protein